MLFLHFLGLQRSWAWQIPMRNGITSVGVVTEKDDFKRAGEDPEQFMAATIARSKSFSYFMENAELVRPFKIETDYSYKIDQIQGPGWLLIGDALRFVDPIFSTGVDVASYSALYAFEAIRDVLAGADEAPTFQGFEDRVSDGVDAWYELISMFYRLQNVFTMFAVKRAFREKVVRILQGNLYQPESLARAQEMIATMKDAEARANSNPNSLLRRGALKPEPTAGSAA